MTIVTSDDWTEGELVRYYLEGWRFGHYAGRTAQRVKIKPIKMYGEAKCILVPAEDVEKVTPC